MIVGSFVTETRVRHSVTLLSDSCIAPLEMQYVLDLSIYPDSNSDYDGRIPAAYCENGSHDVWATLDVLKQWR